MATLRLLFVLALTLCATTAEAQKRAAIRTILADAGNPPSAVADTSVADLPALLALTGRAIGDTITVASNGQTYAVIDSSGVPGLNIVDGVRVLAFDEDVETVTATMNFDVADGYSFGDQVLFGSVRITGPDAGLVIGPDSLSDIDLAPMQESGLNGQPKFDHFSGTILQSTRVQLVMADYGATVDVSARRVRDGVTKRLLWIGFDGYDPSEYGALPGSVTENYPLGTTFADSLDAYVTFTQNGKLLHWLSYFAEQMPVWTDRVVRWSETIEVQTFVYRDSTRLHGIGSTTPALRFPGNDMTWFPFHPSVDTSDVHVYAESRLGNADPKGVRHELLTRLDLYDDFYFDGNQRDNTRIWTNPEYYNLNDSLVPWLQNAPRAMQFDFGEQGGLAGPPEDGEGYAGRIYIHGTLRVTDGIQGILMTGAGPTYQMNALTATDTLWIGDSGPDDNHHCTYTLNGYFANVKSTGRSCDMMWQNDGLYVERHTYSNPTEPLWTNGNTGAVGNIDRSFSPIPMRRTEDALYPYDTLYVGRIEYDLPSTVDNILGLPEPADINFAPLGGFISMTGRDNIDLLRGATAQGYFGSDVTTGADSLVITNDQPFRTTLQNGIGHTRGGVLTFRGLRHVDNFLNNEGSEPLLEAGEAVGNVSTTRIEHSDLLNRLGQFVSLNTVDSTTIGHDYHIVDTDVNFGRYVLSQTSGNGCAGTYTASKDSIRKRVRFVVDGNSVIDDLYWGACSPTHGFDEVIRLFDGARDVNGLTAVETDSWTTNASAEGQTEVCHETGLMWAPREINVTSITSTLGSYSAVSTRALGYDRNSGGAFVEYVYPDNTNGYDFERSRVCVTVDAPIQTGAQLTINYTARVTPLAAQRMSRPYLADPLPSPTVLVQGSTDIDLDSVFANRDWQGNPGAGSLTYTFLYSSNPAIADASMTDATTLRITRSTTGTAILYVDAVDEAGTVTRAGITVTL